VKSRKSAEFKQDIAFGEHGLNSHGIGTSQLTPVNWLEHAHEYSEKSSEFSHIPEFWQGSEKQGTTVSQNSPVNPGAQWQMYS
jgi:hypothetical protein